MEQPTTTMKMANKPPVIRRLFQDEDSVQDGAAEAAADRLQEDLRAAQLRDMERWNFDFARGVPLPGRWEWERVGPPRPGAPEGAPGDEDGGGAGGPDDGVAALPARMDPEGGEEEETPREGPEGSEVSQEVPQTINAELEDEDMTQR